MPFYYTPYIILPLLSTFVNAWLAYQAVRRYRVSVVQPVFLLLASMSGWSLAYAVNLSSTELLIKILCYKFGTTFVCMIVPCILWLSLESVGLAARLTKLRLFLVSIIPFISVLLVWTSEFHFLQRYAFYLYNSGPLLLLGFKQGPFFVVHLFYAHLLNSVAIGIFVSGFLRTPRNEWPRYALLITATALPVIVSFFQITPVKGLDTTTSTLFFSGICYAIAIFRHGLLDLVPVARDTLFEMMIEPVLVIDRQGRLATANRAALDLFKLNKDCIGTFDASLLDGYPFMKEVVIRSTDSLEGYFVKEETANRSWHVTKARIEVNCKLQGWIVVMRDITTLSQTQKELSSIDERFRTLAENLADTVWQIDWEYRFIYISNADYKMRGFKQEEVIGQTIFEIMAVDGAAEMHKIHEKRLSQEKRGCKTGSIRSEVQLKCKDGSYIWTEINSNPLRNSDGLIIGYIGSIRDISERKKIEEELFAEKNKLTEALRVSDNYLTQLQELNARIKGVVEEEERSRLCRDLHDGAGQSLHAIRLHLMMLADGKGGYGDPKQLAAQLAQEVADVAMELREIAHQLRPSYLMEIPLDRAVVSRCEMLKRRGVAVEVSCEGDFSSLPHTVIDNLYRITQEALANAARHAGADLIMVKLTHISNQIQLVISDDGCGMEGACIDNSGMGLRIMRERSALAGAKLDIASSASGTTITVLRDMRKTVRNMENLYSLIET